MYDLVSERRYQRRSHVVGTYGGGNGKQERKRENERLTTALSTVAEDGCSSSSDRRSVPKTIRKGLIAEGLLDMALRKPSRRVSLTGSTYGAARVANGASTSENSVGDTSSARVICLDPLLL